MIACTLMDIDFENDSPDASTLVDFNAKLVVVFERTAEGEVLINQQEGIAVAAEGHVFNSSIKSSVATEVLQRYMETGVDGLLAMNGRYAVVVYDCSQQKLIGLTDTLSNCSLFYEQPNSAGNRFSISNTLSWFKKTKEKGDLDLAYMVAYLGGRPKPVSRTPFREVQRIPLATRLTFEGQKRQLKHEQYWWAFPQKTSLSAETCAHRLNEVMTEVTNEYINYYGDSIGVLLSGGLDSSYVYGVAARIGQRPPPAFHYSFAIQDCNELEWAEAVVDHYGGDLVPLDFKKIWTFQGFPDVPVGEEPVSWTFRSKEIVDCAAASHGIRLMLDGLGGDDFFDAPWDTLFIDLLTWQHPIRTLKRLNNRVKYDGYSYIDIIRQVKRGPQRMLSSLPEYISPSLMKYEQTVPRLQGKTGVQRHMEMCLRLSRPSIGLPSPHIHQSPLYDPRVIEVAAALPGDMLRSNKEAKVALRKAACSYLPASVVNRKKENPHTPILWQGLQREWTTIMGYFQEDARLYDIGLVDREKFISTLQSFRGGNDESAQHIIYAFACEAWLAKQ